MCYNGTFRFKKLDDSFWNGETFRFADYTVSLYLMYKHGIFPDARRVAPIRGSVL